MTRVKSLTLTVITESTVALSNDQGTGGNYTPVKKMFYKDGIHLFASVSTFTYELRKLLHEEFDWSLFDIVVNTDKAGKITNLYNIHTEEKNREADLFGYLIPNEQISRTAPLRVIPPVSVHKYHSDTQLITNRGFLEQERGRNYFNNKMEKLEHIPSTQALATEEVMGDYYVYTVTVELDRIGRIETQKKDNKVEYLKPHEYRYHEDAYRKSIVIDLLEALKILTRDIKHRKVFLEPIGVFGGLFERVVPYFANSVAFNNNRLDIENIKQAIENYKLDQNSYLIKALNHKVPMTEANDFSIDENPVARFNDLIEFVRDKVVFDDQKHWMING